MLATRQNWLYANSVIWAAHALSAWFYPKQVIDTLFVRPGLVKVMTDAEDNPVLSAFGSLALAVSGLSCVIAREAHNETMRHLCQWLGLYHLLNIAKALLSPNLSTVGLWINVPLLVGDMAFAYFLK